MIGIFIETNPNRWQHCYDFPDVHEERVIKENFSKETPADFMGFVFHTHHTILNIRE
ncbi:hypothetical protein [Bartonella sp. MM73XJBT]|uniref:hypothetical protein n=1 Tax=Bartonella sp. MM73XJBT TaxID=3019095 RepID=UPI002360B86E|nr:hypothetical protein [Bartonella sp. MM73XJBT]